MRRDYLREDSQHRRPPNPLPRKAGVMGKNVNVRSRPEWVVCETKLVLPDADQRHQVNYPRIATGDGSRRDWFGTTDVEDEESRLRVPSLTSEMSGAIRAHLARRGGHDDRAEVIGAQSRQRWTEMDRPTPRLAHRSRTPSGDGSESLTVENSEKGPTGLGFGSILKCCRKSPVGGRASRMTPNLKQKGRSW